MYVNFLVCLQIILGICTVLTQKHPHVASMHVAIGAGTLAMMVLLLLRAAPLNWNNFKAKLNES
jgi:heme A synthase